MAKRPNVAFEVEPVEGGEANLWFLVPVRDEWQVAYRVLIDDDGGLVVAELRVLPLGSGGLGSGRRPPPGGLTAGLLKDEVVMGNHVYTLLPEFLRELRATAEQYSAGGDDETDDLDSSAFVTRKALETMPAEVVDEFDSWEVDLVGFFNEWIGRLGFDAEVKPRVGRRGPKGWPDEQYAALACEYVERCKQGSRSPVKDVAVAHRNLSTSAVRGALNRARDRGLLTRQKTGLAGGELTAAAKALLESSKTKRKKGKS